MLVTNYYSRDCDLRTKLQQLLQSHLLLSEGALRILEMAKVQLRIGQAE